MGGSLRLRGAAAEDTQVCRPGRDEGRHPARVTAFVLRCSAQLNESPHAHEPVAFGLSMVKPCFSMVSTKSIEAPST